MVPIYEAHEFERLVQLLGKETEEYELAEVNQHDPLPRIPFLTSQIYQGLGLSRRATGPLWQNCNCHRS
jgi:hypothetical protein